MWHVQLQFLSWTISGNIAPTKSHLKSLKQYSHPFARKLSYENRRLHQTMEREIHEKKKLSQENEQLQWKIRQSFVASGHDSSMMYTR